MFVLSYSLYKIHLPRHWLVHDEPIQKTYLRSQDVSNHTELLFHVSKGDYLSTLATILRFFEEAIYEQKLTPEMRQLELNSIKRVINDLLYLDKNFDIVPKNKDQG